MEKYQRKINQGTIDKNCDYCGKPMTVAKGNVTEFFNEDKKSVRKIVAPDQKAIYHKACRKEGRRMERKNQKESLKLKLKK